VTQWLASAAKYLASFRKREWDLEDYPVRVRFQQGKGPREFTGWVAQIQRWWLAGSGSTPEAALQQLRDNLVAAKREGNHPRPGTRPPIRFASAERLERHGAFAYEFVERVTGICPMFMSDQSSLADFVDGPELKDVTRKISLLYNVDPGDLPQGPLWRLLDKIHPEEGAAQQADAADEVRDG
jgi:hypothetical protein